MQWIVIISEVYTTTTTGNSLFGAIWAKFTLFKCEFSISQQIKVGTTPSNRAILNEFSKQLQHQTTPNSMPN